MSSPKIVIIKLKELIYTALFAILGVILIILLIYMFIPKNKDAKPTMKYYPGIYTSSLMLEDKAVNVEVKVSKNAVESIRFTHLDPNIEGMYPFLQPTMANIEKQMVKNQNIKKIKPNQETKETTFYLVNVVEKALDKARVK